MPEQAPTQAQPGAEQTPTQAQPVAEQAPTQAQYADTPTASKAAVDENWA